MGLYPHGHLHELPQGATVIDFAYSASLFLGNHAVGAKIDGEIRPLSTPLVSGQVIDIITDVLATPNPDWLSFINTQRHVAQSRICCAIKISMSNSWWVNKHSTVLSSYLIARFMICRKRLVKCLAMAPCRNQRSAFEQIAVGDLLPQLVANHLFSQDTPQKPMKCRTD